FNIAQENDQLRLDPLSTFLPMRRFGGKALVAANFQAYYDFSDKWIPLIEQRRPRYDATATLFTPRQQAPFAFDRKRPDCLWHRLMLGACIPSETTVEGWSRAANDASSLATTAWQPEPGPYLRSEGSELPFANNFPGGEASSGTWELLFQNARGR